MQSANNERKRGHTDVGIWYCTYFNNDWDSIGSPAYPPVMYRPLCSDRPDDFRTYHAADPDVIDYHLRQIADAGIDFVLFELTPLRFDLRDPDEHQFIKNARAVAQRIKVWNDNHARRIRYALAVGAHTGIFRGDPIARCMELEARAVYESFYLNNDYGGPENYYRLDDKPLLVFWGRVVKNSKAWNNYEGDKTFGDRFSIRYAQDVREGTYGWNIYESGTALNSEVEVVSPGWGHYTREDPPYVSRRCGHFYEKCWRTVLDNPLPKIVMIVAFNDYFENTAVWTTDTSMVTDADKWEGHDGQLRPSLYWDMTVRYINEMHDLTGG